MTAYRTSAPLCPTCHEPLQAHTTASSSATVDLCARCGGVWIDWEDGDLTEVAREVPATAARTLPRTGKGTCPRCHGQLVVELFQEAAEVLRCGDCGGAFLPYTSIGKIAASTPAEARAEAREEADREGVWRRAVEVVRGWWKGA